MQEYISIPILNLWSGQLLKAYNLGGISLLNKKGFILLMLILAVTTTGALLYLQLNQECYWMLSNEKDNLIHLLYPIKDYAADIDYKKITSGDKEAVNSLIKMDKQLCVLYYVTDNACTYSKFIIIDPCITQKNMSDMDDILDRYIKGKIKPEDINKINLIAEDTEVMYNYVSENDKFGIKKCSTELAPKLKNLYSRSNQ